MGTGINRYLTNLLFQMQKVTPGVEEFKMSVLLPSVAELNGSQLVPGPGFAPIPCPAMKLPKVWRLGIFLHVVKSLKVDALFLPSPLPIYFKPPRLAVTVHDIIPFLFPREYRSLSMFALRRSYVSSLRKADLVFTDSEYSKADMVNAYAVPPERIVVAYLGFDSSLFHPAPLAMLEEREVLRRYGINQPYVLHAGRVEFRKNLVRLVQAYRLLTARRKDLSFQLVLCGRLSPSGDEVLRLSDEPTLQGKVILTGPVPDRDLAILYRGADCFAIPSLYEGFGLPLVEAMASGVPVMSSNRSCLPEIGDNAPMYFNPESVEEMSAVMEGLLTESALRKQVVERGLERAKHFSWEACAQTTLTALRSL